MTLPILFLYLIGLVMFVIGIEDTSNKLRSIIYFGIAFMSELMGYYLSYQDADYLQAAYFPLVMMAIIIVVAIYTAWETIPKNTSWEEQANSGEDD